MRDRYFSQRLLISIVAVSSLTWYSVPIGNAQSNGASGSAIEIPEGTPIIIHFFGSAMRAFNSCHLGSGNERDKEIVVQVDENVSVGGVVVVPRGSVGLAVCDQVKNGKYNQDYGDVKVTGLLGERTVHQKGPGGTGVIQYVFHNLYVFSTFSTQLDLEPTPDFIDVAHHNARFGAYGLDFDVNTQFTARLKHAVVTVPRSAQQ